MTDLDELRVRTVGDLRSALAGVPDGRLLIVLDPDTEWFLPLIVREPSDAEARDFGGTPIVFTASYGDQP